MINRIFLALILFGSWNLCFGQTSPHRGYYPIQTQRSGVDRGEEHYELLFLSKKSDIKKKRDTSIPTHKVALPELGILFLVIKPSGKEVEISFGEDYYEFEVVKESKKIIVPCGIDLELEIKYEGKVVHKTTLNLKANERRTEVCFLPNNGEK